jgi:hypothetical protein
MAWTKDLWILLSGCLLQNASTPAWLKAQLHLDYEAMRALPPPDGTGEEKDARPSCEDLTNKPDYFEFLRDQIRIDAQGHEMREILKNRLAALEPFAGKSVVRLSFHRGSLYASVYFDPTAQTLLLLEIYR